MPFIKGQGRPENSGRKPGSRNKKTIWLNEVLSDIGFSWSQELKKAYEEKDYKKIELLQQLIPYLNPKIKDKEIDDNSDDNSLDEIPPKSLVSIITNE